MLVGVPVRHRLLALPVAALGLALLGAQPPAPASHGLLLTGDAAEAFLKSAKVVKKKALSVGITNSHQLTLTDGERTLKAVWKVIDEQKRGITQFREGGFEVDFRDSYKYEVAAYELDKILGMELVPPTVERVVDGETGSLQLWVEGCMTEADRKSRKIEVPDTEAWNKQIYKVRLIHNLTYNSDFKNIRNVLLDPEFRVYAIDFSRAFRLHSDLLAENDLVRFSRAALERIRALERPILVEKLGRWLTGPEIDGVLKRRTRILALAEQRVAEQGEARALY